MRQERTNIVTPGAHLTRQPAAAQPSQKRLASVYARVPDQARNYIVGCSNSPVDCRFPRFVRKGPDARFRHAAYDGRFGCSRRNTMASWGSPDRISWNPFCRTASGRTSVEASPASCEMAGGPRRKAILSFLPSVSLGVVAGNGRQEAVRH